MNLQGTLRSLVLFDVADSIHLDQVERALGESGGPAVRGLPHAAPQYVRLERPPVVETYVGGRVKYYDYGVISVESDLPFAGDWGTLVEQSYRWVGNPDVEKQAEELIKPRIERFRAALTNPYPQWLSEDYFVVLIDGLPCSAKEVLGRYGREIAQVVRGEIKPLSDDESEDVLRARMSYYPDDLAVVGWSTALVCDSPTGGPATVQLLEYANSQLLEYRHYDERLTRVLKDVYQQLDEGTGFFARWRMAARAAELNTIRLDVIELTERTDNAIKFLSDMFSARLYKLAASRVGVPDYRNLVDEKLQTAGELYEFMMDQFQHGRAFVLELMVVLILMIELVFVFRGK